MSLLDQFGRSIPAAEIRRLLEPEATPTLAGVRPAFSFHQADNLTPAKLASIHRLAAQGDGRNYMELAEDIEERDLHYSAVLRTRRLSVAGLPITVEAASDDRRHMEHADLIRRWLDECVLEEALFDILDAIGKGYSVHEIVWRTEPGRTWPERFIYRPQRWFDPDRTDGAGCGGRPGRAARSAARGDGCCNRPAGPRRARGAHAAGPDGVRAGNGEGHGHRPSGRAGGAAR